MLNFAGLVRGLEISSRAFRGIGNSNFAIFIDRGKTLLVLEHIKLARGSLAAEMKNKSLFILIGEYIEHVAH